MVLGEEGKHLVSQETGEGQERAQDRKENGHACLTIVHPPSTV